MWGCGGGIVLFSPRSEGEQRDTHTHTHTHTPTRTRTRTRTHTQEHTGTHRNTQEHTGTHRNTQENTGTYTRMLHLPFSDLPLKKCQSFAQFFRILAWGLHFVFFVFFRGRWGLLHFGQNFGGHLGFLF